MTDDDRAPSTVDRRTLLKAGTAATALGAVVGPAAAGHAHQFETVRDAAVEPYLTDPQAAAADGFEIMGPYVPSMGWHFLNEDHVNDAIVGGIDITAPQVLVYVDERFVPPRFNRLSFDDETGLRLGAVEYAVPRDVVRYSEDDPPDLFDDEHADLETSETEGWVVHHKAEHAFATPDGTATARSHDEAAYWAERLETTNWLELVPGGVPGNTQLSAGDEVKSHFGHGSPFQTRTVVSSGAHPDLLTLHVWLGVDNPDGVFSPHNHALGDGGHDH